MPGAGLLSTKPYNKGAGCTSSGGTRFVAVRIKILVSFGHDGAWPSTDSFSVFANPLVAAEAAGFSREQGSACPKPEGEFAEPSG